MHRYCKGPEAAKELGVKVGKKEKKGATGEEKESVLEDSTGSGGKQGHTESALPPPCTSPRCAVLIWRSVSVRGTGGKKKRSKGKSRELPEPEDEDV